MTSWNTAGIPKYFVGVDTGRDNSVPVVEIWASPTLEFPMGGYRLIVDSRVMMACGELAQDGVPDSPYWHSGSPFTMYAGLPEDWRKP